MPARSLLLDGAVLAEAEFDTGASGRNWSSFAAEVSLPARVMEVGIV